MTKTINKVIILHNIAIKMALKKVNNAPGSLGILYVYDHAPGSDWTRNRRLRLSSPAPGSSSASLQHITLYLFFKSQLLRKNVNNLLIALYYIYF